MKDVSLGNYGSGWQWHATTNNGRRRDNFAGARDLAVKQYGLAMVLRAEVLTMIRDPYVLAYAAEQCACAPCFSASFVGGWDLLHTPDIDAKRYGDYRRAAEKLGLPSFANMPPNGLLVIRAAAGDGRAAKTLADVGQLGRRDDSPTERFPLSRIA